MTLLELADVRAMKSFENLLRYAETDRQGFLRLMDENVLKSGNYPELICIFYLLGQLHMSVAIVPLSENQSAGYRKAFAPLTDRKPSEYFGPRRIHARA